MSEWSVDGNVSGRLDYVDGTPYPRDMYHLPKGKLSGIDWRARRRDSCKRRRYHQDKTIGFITVIQTTTHKST